VNKITAAWYSERVGQKVNVARWGHAGQPVLLFPTAGGDFEECERFLMLRVLAPLIEAGRIKVYSVDSIAGRTWMDDRHGGGHKAWVQSRFDAFVMHELVPAMRTDCGRDDIEVITAGASIGAFNALSTLCRHPDVFRAAICMSGTYDLGRWTKGEHTFDYHVSSPLHFVPDLAEDSAQLALLRRRFVLLATGNGRYEAPHESWAVARTLGARGIPNRVDIWEGSDHDWTTWRAMLPKYLDALTES
jgi:esterase/lipase superfamily enzyme